MLHAIRHNALSILLLAGTFAVVGCDDGTTDGPAATEERGFTKCGGATCQPGQYCADSSTWDCVNGCLSDVNCASNQTCDTIGNQCVNNVAAPVDDAARCSAACDTLMSCGAIDATGLGGCKTFCSVGGVQAKSAADCVANGADCSAKSQCVPQ